MAWVYLNRRWVKLENVTYVIRHVAGGGGGLIHFTGGNPLQVNEADIGMIESALEALQPTVGTSQAWSPEDGV